MLDFSFSLQQDFNTLFLGKRLGEGVGREVFEYQINPRWVVKLENHGLQNYNEAALWFAVEGTPWAEWFAPVRWLSSNGRVLIMDRTRTPAKNRPLPEFIPNFMTDVKTDNMGILRGRWVFHDYGYSNVKEVGLRHAGLVPWPDEQSVAKPEINAPWELP